MTNAPELTVELQQAEQYFLKRLHAETWTNAAEEERSKALSTALTLMKGAFVFAETAYFLNVATGAVVWNPRVVAAVCEQALHLMKVDPTEYPSLLTMGISEAEAGGASAKFDKSFVAPLVCDAAKTIVGDLGTFIGGAAGRVRAAFLGW